MWPNVRRIGAGLTCGAVLVSSCVTARPPRPPPHAHHEKRPPRSPPLAAAATRQDGATASPVRAEPPHAEQELAALYRSRAVISVQDGEASYYGDALAGHKTASGERYDPRAFTAAHRSLALGSVVRVVRVDTGASVYVRVTDRGPFGSAHRIIDLSRAAAERLGMIRRGVAEVRLELLETGAGRHLRK